MDQGVESVGDRLSDHFPPRHEFRVESVKDVFEVFAFFGLFRVEKFQKVLNEFLGDKGFQGSHIGSVIYNQLEEKLVNRLEVRPGGVNGKFFFAEAHFSWDWSFLDHGKGSEHILLDHFDDLVEVGDHLVDYSVLVVKDVRELRKDFQALVFLCDFDAFVIEIERLGAERNLLKECVLVFGLVDLNTFGAGRASASSEARVLAHVFLRAHLSIHF